MPEALESAHVESPTVMKKTIESKMCPPSMFPKSRRVRDSGRARWLISSIGTMSGASAGIGPAKCLRYAPSPCARIPIQWYEKNTTSAHARLVFTLSVGAVKPGTSPRRFEAKMKRPSVAIRGRNRRPAEPITSSISDSTNSRTVSAAFWSPRGTSAGRRGTRYARTMSTAITSHVKAT